MASWIRKAKDETNRFREEDDGDARLNHAGQDVDDGEQIDRPDGIDPLDSEAFMRLRSILWADLQTAGCSLRKIASLFGTDKDYVARAIKDVPAYVRVDRRPSERYFDRLRKAIELNPPNLQAFTELMQRQSGTLGFEAGVFHGMGVRRHSVDTVLCTPRKSRVKSKGAA